MKRNYFTSIRRITAVAFAAVICGQSVNAQDVINLKESDYTVPTWTVLRAALGQMTPANVPYSVNMTLNGNPATGIGFAWFTNVGAPDGKIQIVAKANATAEDFQQETLTKAAEVTTATLNYLNESKNAEVIEKTGIEANTKMDFTSHKVLVDGLTPGTTYSYRVGDEGAWSEIGSFTTAFDNKEPYSFIYITDTQANTEDMFEISRKTVTAAQRMVPDARFVLCNGDLVETSGSSNSEWEWQQWFSTMQSTWMNYPLVVAQGNHDTSDNSNFWLHFNTNNDYNGRPNGVPTKMNGSVYSFVYGDALFMVINYEDYKTAGYFESLANWMREQVEAYPNVKWRIATYHKNMFTGSQSHQSDNDGKLVRAAMLPVFDELKIDVALQGHDHIYEVIGPVQNATKTLVKDGVQHVEIVGDGNERENMTGKSGGVFNVDKGTLYFLNNSAGKKKYEPRNEEQMIGALPQHEVENYWGLFSGKFGQTGEATFSKVELSTDTIAINTYTVDANGATSLFDSFKVIKENKIVNDIQKNNQNAVNISLDEANRKVLVQGVENAEMNAFSADGKIVATTVGNELNMSGLSVGNYVVRVKKDNNIYSKTVIIK